MHYLELSTMPASDLGIIIYGIVSVITSSVAVWMVWKRGE